MAKQYLMPYTNLHELNLDWLINAMKQLEASWDGLEMKTTASIETIAGNPEVIVSGSLKDTLNFDFKLPQGSAFPSTDTPLMDNENGAVGVSEQFARGDHIHPSDTTKLDKIISNETKLYAASNNAQVMLPEGYFAKTTQLETKQDILVSGNNIKTINNTSILGAGNLNIFDLIYPVGSLYITGDSNFLPSEAFGGSWNLQATSINVHGKVYGDGYTLALTEGIYKSGLANGLAVSGTYVNTYSVDAYNKPVGTTIESALSLGKTLGVPTAATVVDDHTGLVSDEVTAYIWKRMS